MTRHHTAGRDTGDPTVPQAEGRGGLRLKPSLPRLLTTSGPRAVCPERGFRAIEARMRLWADTPLRQLLPPDAPRVFALLELELPLRRPLNGANTKALRLEQRGAPVSQRRWEERG